MSSGALHKKERKKTFADNEHVPESELVMPLIAERRVLQGKCRLDGVVQRMTDREMQEKTHPHMWTRAPIIIVKNNLVLLFVR